MNPFKKLSHWARSKTHLIQENEDFYKSLLGTASENLDLRKKILHIEDQLHSSHEEMVHWKEKALLFMSYHKEKNGRSS